MGFGQYSPAGQSRKSKRDMIASLPGPITKSRMVARNTIEYETPAGETVTRLHGTDVVRKLPDGSIFLDTGGWNTMTTRGRMSGALPTGYTVYTWRGALYLRTPKGDHEFTRTAHIGPRGGVETDIADGEAASYDEVRGLVDRYLRKLRDGGIPTDVSGDPWVLPDPQSRKYPAEQVMLWLGDPKTCEAWGEDVAAEPYVFGTFIYNALRFCGFRDSAIGHIFTEFNQRSDSHWRKHVCRSVRRYIRACLGYASS